MTSLICLLSRLLIKMEHRFIFIYYFLRLSLFFFSLILRVWLRVWKMRIYTRASRRVGVWLIGSLFRVNFRYGIRVRWLLGVLWGESPSCVSLPNYRWQLALLLLLCCYCKTTHQLFSIILFISTSFFLSIDFFSLNRMICSFFF